jgi:hypothetical protein
MLGWFRKKERVSGADWVAIEFRAYKAQIERSSAVQLFAFSSALAVLWNGFLGTFGSAASFAKLSREEQMDYLRKSTDLFVRMQETNFEAALPQRMMNFYLAFLINGHNALENEAAAFLDRYAQKDGNESSSTTLVRHTGL